MTTDAALDQALVLNSSARQEAGIETGRASGIDAVALLTLALVVILYHVLVPDLRESTQIGLSLRADTLRKVLTVVLGFGAAALVIVTRARIPPAPATQVWGMRATLLPDGPQASDAPKGMRGEAVFFNRLAAVVLALYTVFVGAYTFFGFEAIQQATGSLLPTVMELAAIASVIALWRPWTRLDIYGKGLRRIATPLIMFVGVLVVWELVIEIFQIRQFLLPAPSVIISTLGSVYPRLVGQGWFTFQNALWGFAIGCGVGILFGLASARFIGFSRAMLPYAVAANSIPIIAMAPIMNQWFGVTNPGSKIAVVVVLTFFPAMINTVRGLTSTNPTSIELMQTYAANEIQIFLKVRLPDALPYIFNALKVASTLSMIGALVAEYFGGPTFGLGVNIADNAALSKFPLVWAQIVVASLLGLGFYFVVSLVERLVMPWHVSFRPQSD